MPGLGARKTNRPGAAGWAVPSPCSSPCQRTCPCRDAHSNIACFSSLPAPPPPHPQKFGKNFDELEPMQRVQVGGTIGGEHRKEQMAQVGWEHTGCPARVGEPEAALTVRVPSARLCHAASNLRLFAGLAQTT